jgi:site-specific DNA recombinase
MKDGKIDACYCRYSSENQRGNTSIETQIQSCERYADKKLTHYIDEAKTGRSIAGRDALQRLISDTEAGRIGRLFLYKYDRLGRSAHTHAVVSDLEELGVEVISVTEGRDALARGVQLVVGEHYSRQLGERVAASQLIRFNQRAWVGGPPPFGYRIVHREKVPHLEIDGDEAKIVRFIAKTYLSESIGVKEIARRLAARGMPTRHGKPWAFTTIRLILVNRSLVGEIRFGKRKYKLNRLTGRRLPHYQDPSTHKVYTDEALRILSEEDFNRIQEKMQSRKAARGARTKSAKTIRPFTGLIFCEECGGVYYAQKSNGGKYYYSCSNRQSHGRQACPKSPSIREDQLLADVRNAYAAIFNDAESFIAEIVQEAEKSIGANRDDAYRLRQQISELDKMSRGITALLVDPSISKAAKDELQRQLEQVGAERAPLQASLDGMSERATLTTERLITGARGLFEKAQKSLDVISSPAELHTFIERFVGPSVARVDGSLVPQLPEMVEGTGVSGALGNMAAAGLEPATRGL